LFVFISLWVVTFLSRLAICLAFLMRYPGTMTVEFLPHIEPGLSRKAFMSRLENTIETASNALLPTPMPEHLMDEELTA